MMNRLKWMLVRRYRLAREIRGFHASPLSYAKNTIFSEYSRLYNYSVVLNSSLGRFTYLSVGARVVNSNIGGLCSIGPDAIVGGLGRHPTSWLSTHPTFYSRLMQVGITFSDGDYFDELIPVTIGNDVWIGARAIVLDGVNIGDGAVIAAGAVVSRDIEPYAIVGGVPARVIRYRFDENTIARLLDIKWWNWSNEMLQVSAPVLRSADIAALEAKAAALKCRS